MKSAKILLVPPKGKIIMVLSHYIFFLNILVFFLLHPIMLSLLTSLLHFLYQFCTLVLGFFSILLPIYSYRSSSYSNSYTLLKAIALSNGHFSLSPLISRKSDNNRYHDIWKSYNFRESNREKKQ